MSLCLSPLPVVGNYMLWLISETLILCKIYICRSAALQWGDLGSVVFAAFLLLSDKVTTIKQIFMSSTVLAVCPGVRLSSLVGDFKINRYIWGGGGGATPLFTFVLL